VGIGIGESGGMGVVVAGNRNDCLQQDAVGALMAALWWRGQRLANRGSDGASAMVAGGWWWSQNGGVRSGVGTAVSQPNHP